MITMATGRGREVLSGTEARLTGRSPCSEEWLSQRPDSRVGADGGYPGSTAFRIVPPQG